METVSNKPSQTELAQLRAEMRRRKILERGDERMRKLFKESKDETSQLIRGESIEERNRNLMDEIIKDPKVMERINSIQNESSDFNQSNDQNKGTINDTSQSLSNEVISNDSKKCNDKLLDQNGSSNEAKPMIINSQSTTINKPKIDLSYFDKLEKEQKLRQQKSDLSKFELLIINLINILTIKRDVILINLFKILFACLSSYFCLNIVTPFILSQSIVFFYKDILNQESDNQFRLKISYTSIKNTLYDSFKFVFFYTIIQTFILI